MMPNLNMTKTISIKVTWKLLRELIHSKKRKVSFPSSTFKSHDGTTSDPLQIAIFYKHGA